MKTPGPDHPMSIERNPLAVRVLFQGREIAKTSRALTLREASYPAVLYIPREDADMARFQKTDRSTHCPYKGDASYFSLVGQEGTVENAVWTYERPFPAAALIEGHLAFYPSHVTIEEGPA